MSKTILMTGAGGFVGGNLKPFLEDNGFKVIAPKSKDYDFTDLKTVEDLVSTYRPDFFVLAGFYGISDPKNIAADIEEKNLAIFNNFVKTAAGKKIITFGSGAEFDKSRAIIKAKESDLGQVIPQDLYGHAKYAISREIKKHPNVLNLRLFGVYGPNEFDSRFITHASKCNLAGKPITMRQDVVFDYIPVEDLCRITLEFINKTPKAQFINITPDKGISLMEIAQIINKIALRESEIICAKEGMANEYTGDNSVLKAELPGFAFTSYKDGIKNFYNYLKEKANAE